MSLLKKEFSNPVLLGSINDEPPNSWFKTNSGSNCKGSLLGKENANKAKGTGSFVSFSPNSCSKQVPAFPTAVAVGNESGAESRGDARW